MSRRIAAVVVVTMVVVTSLVLSIGPAKAHGTCGVGARFATVNNGTEIAITLYRNCTEGHARLRMTGWIQRKVTGGSWTQISPSQVLECLQCRNQSQRIIPYPGYRSCVHAHYRVHVSSANVFNAAEDNVTSSHTQYVAGTTTIFVAPQNVRDNDGTVLC
jgi:hypothetical protein